MCSNCDLFVGDITQPARARGLGRVWSGRGDLRAASVEPRRRSHRAAPTTGARASQASPPVDGARNGGRQAPEHVGVRLPSRLTVGCVASQETVLHLSILSCLILDGSMAESRASRPRLAARAPCHVFRPARLRSSPSPDPRGSSSAGLNPRRRATATRRRSTTAHRRRG